MNPHAKTMDGAHAGAAGAAPPDTETERPWTARPWHRHYLLDQAFRLLGFHRAGLVASGHFVELADDGTPLSIGDPVQQLFVVARAVHCYALGELLGVPGCAPLVERGLASLWHEHRDPQRGGYVEAVGPEGPVTPAKVAYGHAFVLLAASSALQAGHDARHLLDDVLEVIDEHFWSEEDGATAEAFASDWAELEPYRGANSNMHLCEAFLAASDATGDATLARRAERIGHLLIDTHARQHGWLLPEHYDLDWQPRLDYNRDRLDDRFRPYGATVGHLLEWSRLLCGVGVATGAEWTSEAARALFARAVEVGWDAERGGLRYTVDFDGSPANPDRYWWPIAEGIAAAAVFTAIEPDGAYEVWYRQFWDFAASHFIDHARGGWYAQLDEHNHRKSGPWFGKPDLYHALQACLVPLLPVGPSIAGALVRHAPAL